MAEAASRLPTERDMTKDEWVEFSNDVTALRDKWRNRLAADANALRCDRCDSTDDVLGIRTFLYCAKCRRARLSERSETT
jgi:hypothetical protein